MERQERLIALLDRAKARRERRNEQRNMATGEGWRLWTQADDLVRSLDRATTFTSSMGRFPSVVDLEPAHHELPPVKPLVYVGAVVPAKVTGKVHKDCTAHYRVPGMQKPVCEQRASEPERARQFCREVAAATAHEPWYGWATHKTVLAAWNEPATTSGQSAGVRPKTVKQRATRRIAACSSSTATPTAPIAGGLSSAATGPVASSISPPTERPPTITAGTSSRPTCPRCGREFRKTGVGHAWHVANYLNCVKGTVTA